MEHKEIILSTIAGLATICIGYVVWKHEQAASAEQAQANLDAQQAASDAANQQLMNEIAALPTAGSYAGGNGASQPSYYGTSFQDTGSTSLQSPASQSSDLQQILAAFYPTQPATSSSGTTPTAASNSTPPSAPTELASYITSQLQTGTANQTYNLNLPTSLPSYLPPKVQNIYSSTGTL